MLEFGHLLGLAPNHNLIHHQDILYVKSPLDKWFGKNKFKTVGALNVLGANEHIIQWLMALKFAFAIMMIGITKLKRHFKQRQIIVGYIETINVREILMQLVLHQSSDFQPRLIWVGMVFNWHAKDLILIKLLLWFKIHRLDGFHLLQNKHMELFCLLYLSNMKWVESLQV